MSEILTSAMAREEGEILRRLSSHLVIYVARPDGQAAVRRLHARGLVSWRWGDGPDQGLMLVHATPGGRPRPTLTGGAA